MTNPVRLCSQAVFRLKTGMRRVRTPLVMQLEAADCGAACLGSVLAHFGRWVTLEELRDACAVGRDGSTLEDIALAARKYGLNAVGRSVRIEKLAGLPMPMILYWGFNHFLVLEGIGNGRFYLNDPAEGHRAVDRHIFNRDYTGVVLELSPGPEFQPSGTRPSVLRRLWPLLRDYGSILVRTAIYGLLLALVSLALPVLLATFVDRVLESRQTDLSGALVAAMLAVSVLTCLLTWLQMRTIRELVVRLSVEQSDRYLDSLLRLPMKFFAHRLVGDLTFRMRLIDWIAEIGAGQLVRLAVELVMSVTFLAAMLIYDFRLSLAVLGLGVACIVSTRALTRLRRDRNHQLRREQGILVGLTAGGLASVETLQVTAREADFFSRWSGRQARELAARQDFVELGHVASSLPLLFQILVAAVVFGFGGMQMVSGTMTVGELMGFYVLAGNFLRPVGQLAQFSDILERLDAELARIDDVLKAPPDVYSADSDASPRQGIATLDGRLRLVGRLEMRGVTFGFQRNREPLIKDFDLTVEPGQRVALVGPSGSGKSTLALLAAGLYRPWSGEILFDGLPLSEIPREVFGKSVSMVDQHPVMFAATVRNNLTMWDPTVPDRFVTAAARDAAIHEEIIGRTAGYESMVEEGGRNFSGGQRLRLEVARALVRNPSLIILDEATSALDPMTELEIDNRIRRRGCSCLIVAHRLSTIRDADRIVVIEEGRVVERGTHDELYGVDSVYRRLIDGE